MAGFQQFDHDCFGIILCIFLLFGIHWASWIYSFHQIWNTFEHDSYKYVFESYAYYLLDIVPWIINTVYFLSVLLFGLLFAMISGLLIVSSSVPNLWILLNVFLVLYISKNFIWIICFIFHLSLHYVHVSFIFFNMWSLLVIPVFMSLSAHLNTSVFFCVYFYWVILLLIICYIFLPFLHSWQIFIMNFTLFGGDFFAFFWIVLDFLLAPW